MRIRRTFPIALGVVLVAAAVTLTVELRKSAPPEAARLLPGADAFVYVNYGWVRKANSGKPFIPVTHDPEYERFIQETGFDFDRDLDAAAFAVHYPENWPGGGTGGAAPEPRFSEVFIARFDGGKCAAYLRHTAQSVENYHSVDIFTIPVSGRTVRVAILGVDTVAASNLEDPAAIRGIVDRSRRLASPFGGPALLRRYYKRVQLASPVWIVAHVDPAAPAFKGWSMVLPSAVDLIVSASYNPLHLPLRSGVIHLRAEASAGAADRARTIADKVNLFFTMLHGAEVSVSSPAADPALKALFDSLQVREEGSSAVLSATLPTEVFRKVMDSADQLPSMAPPQKPAPATQEPPSKAKK